MVFVVKHVEGGAITHEYCPELRSREKHVKAMEPGYMLISYDRVIKSKDNQTLSIYCTREP